MNTLKDFLKLKSGKALDLKYPIELFDKGGNRVYYEASNGYWCTLEYDEFGNKIYFGNSDGYWRKGEYEDGKEVYFEDSEGCIFDKRPIKEMTLLEIEK